VNKLLVISYYAPPCGTIGCFRPVQFLTYLPRRGWECTVLTTTVSSYRRDGYSLDDDLGGRVDESRLIRVPAIGPFGGSQPVSLSKEWNSSSNPASRMARRLVATILSPDRHITWLPLAVRGGLNASRSSDLLYAQGPPFSNHMVGIVLKRLTGTPLVSMFEDPWLGMGHRVWHSRAQRRIQVHQERSVIHHSDLILTGTDGFREDLLNRHGRSFANKILTLRMGDMGIVPRPVPPPRSDRRPSEDGITLVYAGSLRRSAQYDAAGLLLGLARFRTRSPQIAARLRLTVYGAVDGYYRELAHSLGLDTAIDFAGFVPHEHAVSAMEAADGLVLLIGTGNRSLRMYTSGKLYQYMAARRPILALVPADGEAATLVCRHNLGMVIPPDDPASIADALARFVRERHTLTRELGDTSSYTAEAITDRAADIFAGMLSNETSS
jgi:glycosyltransferase involved in cell wall biosynthesis